MSDVIDMTDADVYVYWRTVLRSGDGTVHILPTLYPGRSQDNPQPGAYKTKFIKDGPFVPVRVWLTNDDGAPLSKWQDGASLAAMINDQAATIADLEGRWHFMKPVSKADLEHYREHKSWPGDAPPIGDNSRHYGEGFDGIKAEMEDYAETCTAFLARNGGIKTKADADQANNMADAIGDVKGGIARRADELRKVEVQPHLDAQREVNGKFNPLVEKGKTVATLLRQAAMQWTRGEQARLQKIADEAARKANEIAQAKAKADREEWERQRAEALANAEPIELVPPPPEATPVIVAEQVKVQVGGQRGAKRSLKTKMIAVVNDHALALAHFANAPQVIDLVQALAQKAIDAKMPIPPGVSTREEQTL